LIIKKLFRNINGFLAKGPMVFFGVDRKDIMAYIYPIKTIPRELICPMSSALQIQVLSS